jgi:hypothetical protein
MRGHSNGHNSEMSETLAMLALTGGSLFSPAFAFVDVTLPPYSVDSSGVTDAGPAIQMAFNALSGTGQAAWFPHGTYKIVTQVLVPSNLIVWQSPDATIVANVAGATVAAGTVFFAPVPATASATTLSATPAEGLDSYTIQTTVDLTAGTYIQIVNAAHPSLSQIYFVEAVNPGVDATVDHALLYPWASGDAVNTLATAPVSNVTWYGNKGAWTGACVGFFTGALWHSRVQDVRIFGVTGAHADFLIFWNYGSFASLLSDCDGDVSGAVATFDAGFGSAADTCGIERCKVTCSTVTACSGIKWADARACWGNDNVAEGVKWGCILVSDAGTLVGAKWCRFNGGKFLGAAQYGVYVGAGSGENAFTGSILATGAVGGAILDGTGAATMVNNTFERLDVSGTGGTGFTVAAGAKGTRVDSLITDNPGAGCIAAHDELWVGYSHAFTKVAGAVVSPNILVADGGAGADVRIASFDWNSTPASATFCCQANGATRLELSHGQLVLSANGIGPSAQGVGSVVVVDDVRISGAGGSIGLYAPGGTLRIGNGVDAQACTTPLDVAGGYCNRKQTVAATAGGFALAWPDAKSTDTMVFNGHQANIPTYTITPGTGFTVTDSGNLTWEYFIP